MPKGHPNILHHLDDKLRIPFHAENVKWTKDDLSGPERLFSKSNEEMSIVSGHDLVIFFLVNEISADAK